MFLGLAPGGVGKVARCSLSNKKLDVWMDVCRLHEKLGMTPICLRARKNIIITYSLTGYRDTKITLSPKTTRTTPVLPWSVVLASYLLLRTKTKG